ncbi:MAG: hypothetical protein K2H38_12795 [Muribaculaceae bacterium]|nr:hypothetical protein [Muribaculaceae bacterium]
MSVNCKASRKIRFFHIPPDPIVYELFSTSCDVVYDSADNPSVGVVSVMPFRINGTSRTQMTVNTSAAEFAVILRIWKTDGTEKTPAKSSAIAAAMLKSVRSARFDLVPAAAVSSSLTYADSAIVASRQVNLIHDGASNGSFTSTVFKRSASKPSAPSGGTYSNPVPATAGWTDAPPSGSDPVWMSTARFSSEHTGSNSPTWTDPVPATDSMDIEFIWSAKDNPGDCGSHPFDPSAAGDWSKDADDAIWMATAVKSNGVWGDWKKVRVKGETGAKGDPAVSIIVSPQNLVFNTSKPSLDTEVTVEVYKGGSKIPTSGFVVSWLGATAPGGFITDRLKYTFATRGGSTFVFQLTYIPPVEINMQIPFTVTVDGIAYQQSLSVQTVANGADGDKGDAGQNGTDGKNGVWVPPPMLFTDYPPQYQFQSGDLTKTPMETRLDIVVILTPAGKLMPYRCIVSYIKESSSPSPDNDPEHWQACDAGVYRFLATEILWANIGRIDFFNSQAIRIGDQDGMCGYFGTPVSGNGAILYTGGDNVSQASFIVYKDGRIVAKSADIEGTITASNLNLKVHSPVQQMVSAVNGAVLLDVSTVSLPALPNGTCRVIKIVNTKFGSATPADLVLKGGMVNGTYVGVSTDSNTDAPGSTVAISKGGYNSGRAFELVGLTHNSDTVWCIYEMKHV